MLLVMSNEAEDRLSGGARRVLSTLGALGGAQARRVLSLFKQALTEDPGPAVAARADLVRAESLARSAGSLKGGAAKVAQLMAYLEDPETATPAQARAVLARLFDHVPGANPAGIRQVLIEDLGGPPEALFAAWEEQPFAAASLGEVHGATGLPAASAAAGGGAGADLAVKVQYPGVAEALRADLSSDAVLRRLCGAAMGADLQPEALEAIREAVLREVDYGAEAAALRRFRRHYAGDDLIVVPRVHEDRCTGRVLSLDRLRGEALLAFARGGAADAARERVGAAIFRFGFGAPLVHGVLNADPNPGNFIVLGGGERVGVVDFGCCAELPEDLVTCERVMWQALLAGDGECLRYSLYRAGVVREMIVLDSTRYREWERCLALPFRGPRFAFTAAYAREFAAHTRALLGQGGAFTLPPAAVLLWRQRLGLWAVLATLRAEGDFRAALLAMLKAVDMAPAGVR
jgi:predicted unusual protein kinase regulating ubiquinone biosynthesis (AarF/ABC1/UbiB family)